MKVVSIVGARPQFVKLAPLSAAMTAAGHEHHIVHTGQHYDAALSDVFFSGLDIPDPDTHLGVGSGSHGAQTGGVLAALDPVLEKERPDWVLVYGDTNSTLAGALSAVKQHLPVAHLEAGLRSFNRRMPEEHNRVLTDHASDLLLAPTEEALRHLRNEGLEHRAALAGDVMVDVCLRVADRARADGLPAAGLPEGVDPGAPYLLATVHRAENTDDPARLSALADALAELPVPVALLAHPRLLARAEEHGVKLARGAVRVGRPLPYADLVAAALGASGVVTDSGGLQKEAYLLGRPCTTLRPETEWPETLADGWNTLVPSPWELGTAAWVRLAARRAPRTPRGEPYGDGRAAERAVRLLEEHHRPERPLGAGR
ncbi:non-hydrolyzing UDP-N-acetylglucosamine 2-epimerase [Streptomyces boncukensis]|uniref:UDP-N-acetylglucosamine 2-epimerase (Non-hydrolyzing) n=1 Tax=Streptomyces boncukensis TaxID=2711219 RepID=A0A6G4X292_9ACTN|nr:UDP-N-acetylglucosamine 2-epimerase (non-hydrolyzing) [Streptomyces boncukensis]NGO71252.1 UDP-N-acetylglucosamine 2-epimerase (non-hydrolyzing) [Streptomyces boncukensis]